MPALLVRPDVDGVDGGGEDEGEERHDGPCARGGDAPDRHEQDVEAVGEVEEAVQRDGGRGRGGLVVVVLAAGLLLLLALLWCFGGDGECGGMVDLYDSFDNI